MEIKELKIGRVYKDELGIVMIYRKFNKRGAFPYEFITIKSKSDIGMCSKAIGKLKEVSTWAQILYGREYNTP